MKKWIIGGISAVLVIILALLIAFKVMFISKSEVKDIIIKEMQIQEADAKRWSIDFSYEDGSFEYEVDVIVENVEHEFLINAKSGEVILHKVDRDR